VLKLDLTDEERHVLWKYFWDWWVSYLQEDILTWPDEKVDAILVKKSQQPIPIASRRKKAKQKKAA
jgi:hypothetical protein